MINLLLFLLMLQYNLTVKVGLILEAHPLKHTFEMQNTKVSEKIVRDFLLTVRSGKHPDQAGEFLADKVLAHQMNAENPQTVERTPQDYSGHVKEFLRMYGKFQFEITELIAQDNKVYARWKQTGKHLSEIDGYAASGLPLIEVASAVYRIEKGKIVEYWIQIDRAGFDRKLQQTAHN